MHFRRSFSSYEHRTTQSAGLLSSRNTRACQFGWHGSLLELGTAVLLRPKCSPASVVFGKVFDTMPQMSRVTSVAYNWSGPHFFLVRDGFRNRLIGIPVRKAMSATSL